MPTALLAITDKPKNCRDEKITVRSEVTKEKSWLPSTHPTGAADKR
jgi:hypothetical protein